jgi:hypothetical protein
MNIAEIFELDELVPAEPTFAELIDNRYTVLALSDPAADAALLIDEAELPIAYAWRSNGPWQCISFALRQPVVEVIERVEELDGDLFQEDRDTWLDALREYYSERIAHEIEPAPEDNREGRLEEMTELIRSCWGTIEGLSCLDCCCGSGVGSQALKALGAQPLAYDNDGALLSLGLATGRLEPSQTMWIDAIAASSYCRPADLGIGMMLGDITNFNQQIWKEIVAELLSLVKRAIITVATDREASLMASWIGEMEREAEIFESDLDPIYDRWVCKIS